MKTNSTITNQINYPVLFFSALGLGYSIVKFLMTEKYSVIPLFLISLVIFSKNIIPLIRDNKK